MTAKYKFDILPALKEAGYSTYRLRQEKIFGERAIQQFRSGEIASMESLCRLCELLNCDIGDIITCRES